MNDLQFRVLYREFLFRMVDLELLSPRATLLSYSASSLHIDLDQLGPLPRRHILRCAPHSTQ